jgi:alpha-1,2-mannosyltransferase
VTHASGGPFKDIVVPFNGKPTGYCPSYTESHAPSLILYLYSSISGFHAASPETFAEALHTVLTLPVDEELALRRRARTWAVQRFSEEEFEKGWNASGWRSKLSGLQK